RVRPGRGGRRLALQRRQRRQRGPRRRPRLRPGPLARSPVQLQLRQLPPGGRLPVPDGRRRRQDVHPQRGRGRARPVRGPASPPGEKVMTRAMTWVLTDAAADVWVDSFAADNATLRLATPHAWSVHKRTLRGGLRDGVDLIEVNNGALSYAVVPTRGLGLWRGEYRGLFLGWRSPVPGPVHPQYVQAQDRGGIGWLTGFDEWVCRCGLASNGPPGEDVRRDRSGAERRDRLTLHGRIANLPAQFVEVRVGLEPPYELTVIGRVEESGLFYPHLSLTAALTTVPGSNRVVIHD